MIDSMFEFFMTLPLSCFFGLPAIESHSSRPPFGFQRMNENKTVNFSSNIGGTFATFLGIISKSSVLCCEELKLNIRVSL